MKLKRGTPTPIEVSDKCAPKETKIKTFDELLLEVFNGKYDEFQEFLNTHKTTDLEISEKNLNADNLRHLALALTYTSVSNLTLRRNKIATEATCTLALNLKKSKIRKLNLQENHSQTQGFAALMEALEGTPVEELSMPLHAIGVQTDTNIPRLQGAIQKTNLTTIRVAWALTEEQKKELLPSAWNEYQNPPGLADEMINFTAALEGSLVSILELKFHGAARFCYKGEKGNSFMNKLKMKLNRTNVTHLNMNYIGSLNSDGISPETLLEAKTLFTRDRLYFYRAQKPVMMTPFYIECLRFLPKSEKQKHPIQEGLVPISELAKIPGSLSDRVVDGHPYRMNNLEYAAGIVLNILPELANHIKSFLPGMTLRLKNGQRRSEKYKALADEWDKKNEFVIEDVSNENPGVLIQKRPRRSERLANRAMMRTLRK
ncbi:MAG: hypothetical protein ACHQJ6_01770 [Candidatus Berkiellales bacterium]